MHIAEKMYILHPGIVTSEHVAAQIQMFFVAYLDTEDIENGSLYDGSLTI